MAKRAILLHAGEPSSVQRNIARILEFFGVPWKFQVVEEFRSGAANLGDAAVFASINVTADLITCAEPVNRLAAYGRLFFVYPGERSTLEHHATKAFCEALGLSHRYLPSGEIRLSISKEQPALTGPMTGLAVTARATHSLVAVAKEATESWSFESLITAGDAALFARLCLDGASIYFCGSTAIVDIDKPIHAGYFDVKDDFCDMVPLVLFIRQAFKGVAWEPQELGGCLIVDDPLIKKRYGCFNLENVRGLMRSYGFTTNIAFIPWNQHRTSRGAAEFFRNEADLFSLSIHGCDHTKAEFGETSPSILRARARLAQDRMRGHRERTGIEHEPIMVFPQGVFSSECPGVLKENDFLAAVNTEIAPIHAKTETTRIRDVWDIAIMSYGSFAIFTRRYAKHGIENFAFDLLLGKPCLITTHHDFFRDDGSLVIELMTKLNALKSEIKWRSLGGVIKRACRIRESDEDILDVEMYGSELILRNPSNRAISARVQKRESGADSVARILVGERDVDWNFSKDRVIFRVELPPLSETHLQMKYRQKSEPEMARRGLGYELSVGARRVLSEIRDEYHSRRSLIVG